MLWMRNSFSLRCFSKQCVFEFLTNKMFNLCNSIIICSSADGSSLFHHVFVQGEDNIHVCLLLAPKNDHYVISGKVVCNPHISFCLCLFCVCVCIMSLTLRLSPPKPISNQIPSDCWLRGETVAMILYDYRLI